MRLLVACDHLALTGGLMRFERVGQVLARWGGELAFLCLGEGVDDRPAGFASTLRHLSRAAALEETWDAVMVPGGGFPDAIVARLASLRDPRLGLRVQHFLNGPGRREAYQRVTQAFEPDLIVVNNAHWPEADLAAFGRPFRRVVGGVDSTLFAPPVARPPRTGRYRLGAIANKNPAALLDALRALGAAWELHWFGRPDPREPAPPDDLLASGRIVRHGALFGEALAAFYAGLDVFCSVELQAGWCNPAAEAMASGTPLVTTPHGTLAFAEHDITARVIEIATGPAIAAAVEAVRTDPERAARCARAGRARIRDLTWEAYTAELLAAIRGGLADGTAPAWATARIAALVAEHGPAPDDFDAAGYLRLHADLAALFGRPWQGLLHYLEHGRREGRLHPSTRSRAQEKAAQAGRIALVLDGLDGSGKSSIAREVAGRIGATVLDPFGGRIGGLMVLLAERGAHALADDVAHAAVALALQQAPDGPVVFDRHWFTASQLLSPAYRAGWAPHPRTVMCWADRPTTVARLVARGDAQARARMSVERIETYRRLADELGLPLLDTSRISPALAAERILRDWWASPPPPSGSDSQAHPPPPRAGDQEGPFGPRAGGAGPP
ncbi:glycosyltransferase [Methylobacterium sp. Leaf88]|uniref:glycosyltransferase n=1 Tax=Methylobacterium sp. Leaf88 TaxID=1736244 RepID=UPI0009EAC71C|nr:glycosyltransferase [Methylobacterium sp. Leaf88]